MHFLHVIQRQEISASLETLDQCHDVGAPQALTYYSSTLPSSSPRRDVTLRQSKAKGTGQESGQRGMQGLLNLLLLLMLLLLLLLHL